MTFAGHDDYFRELTIYALTDMFACEAKVSEDERPPPSDDYLTEMPFSVRIQFTGIEPGFLTTGEYIIATDERVAAACCMVAAQDATSATVEACREEFSSAFAELLNAVVGEASIRLEGIGTVKFGTPRVSYGKMSYGRLKICRSALTTPAGRVECLFCFDRVKLDM